MDSYCIMDNYVVQKSPINKDMFSTSSEYQREIYVISKEIIEKNKYKNVLDFGCGDGKKTIEFFKDFCFVGIDIEPIVSILKKKYPDFSWITTDEFLLNDSVDLIVCADVIEHFLDPNDLIKFILKIKPKMVIFSTPDRDYLSNVLKQNRPYGPPKNLAHVREWNIPEFNKYISIYFDIHIHDKFRNKGQIGQFVVCSPKL